MSTLQYFALTTYKTGELRFYHTLWLPESWNKCHATGQQLMGTAIQKVEEQVEKLFRKYRLRA